MITSSNAYASSVSLNWVFLNRIMSPVTAVTGDMIRFKNTQFRLTELAYALEEVIIRPYQLTGYLDVDARNVPLNNNNRYQISGLPNVGYEASYPTLGSPLI